MNCAHDSRNVIDGPARRTPEATSPCALTRHAFASAFDLHHGPFALPVVFVFNTPR